MHSSQTWDNLDATRKEKINKNSVPTLEHYSVTKKDEVLMCVSQHMNPEHIMVNGRKPATKGPVLRDYIYMKRPAEMNLQRQKAEWRLPGAGGNGITAEWAGGCRSC